MSEALDQPGKPPKGYQEAQIGPETQYIPKDWDVIRLGDDDYTEITMGGTPDTSVEEYWGGEIPWMRSGDIHQRYITGVEGRITKKGKENSTAEIIPKHSVLIGLNGQGKTKGTVAINEIPLTANQSVGAYIVNEQKLDYRYLYFSLDEKYSRLRALAGGGRSGLNLTLLGQVKIALPPLPEQRYIADILSTVDEKIQQTDEIVEELKNLKRGLVQNLIFFGKSHNGTQTVQLGPKTVEIAESWNVATVGEVTTKAQYGSSESLSTEGEYPVFRMNNIEDGRMVSSPMKYSDLKKEQAEKYRVQKGDILFNRTNSIDLVGKSGIFDLDGEYIFASYLIRLRTNEKMNPYFLNYYLNSHTGQGVLFSIATRGASQANINATNLKSVNVPLPPREQQDRIVDQIQTVEEKIEQEQETKQKLQELKRGLMQDLLTGKVRIDPDN